MPVGALASGHQEQRRGDPVLFFGSIDRPTKTESACCWLIGDQGAQMSAMMKPQRAADCNSSTNSNNSNPTETGNNQALFCGDNDRRLEATDGSETGGSESDILRQVIHIEQHLKQQQQQQQLLLQEEQSNKMQLLDDQNSIIADRGSSDDLPDASEDCKRSGQFSPLASLNSSYRSSATSFALNEEHEEQQSSKLIKNHTITTTLITTNTATNPINQQRRIINTNNTQQPNHLSPRPNNGVNARTLNCHQCTRPISDKYIMKLFSGRDHNDAMNKSANQPLVDEENCLLFHETCLKCSQCACLLDKSCFVHDNKLLCAQDYYR